MESDRRLTLMVRASMSGAIDFQTAQLRDRWWWLRTEWILEELESQDYVKILQTKLMMSMGGMIRTEEVKHANQILQKMEGIWGQLVNLVLPWSAVHSQKKQKALIEQWKSIWGDPDDPEVAKKIAQTVEELKNPELRSPRRFIKKNRKKRLILPKRR